MEFLVSDGATAPLWLARTLYGGLGVGKQPGGVFDAGNRGVGMDDFVGWLNEVTSSGVFQTLGLVALALLVALFFLGQVKPHQTEPKPPEQKPWMRGLGIAGWVLIPLFAILFIASLIQIAVMWTDPPDRTEPLALRVHYLAIVGFIGVLGGILAALAAYIRIFTNERQTTAQEQGLITDRINKAVENLGATRTLKDADGTERHVPNLEVRIGGIYALERIARENLRYHIQVLEILCAYVRENSPVDRATMFDLPKWSPFQPSTFPFNFEKDRDRAANHLVRLRGRIDTWTERGDNENDTGATETWANKLPPLRQDIVAAVKVISRRNAEQRAVEPRIDGTAMDARTMSFDLSYSNLQKADFAGSYLAGFSFEGTALDAATFEDAIIVNSRFDHASMICLRAYGVHTSGSGFNHVSFECAHFSGSYFRHCHLVDAGLVGANFNSAVLDNVDLFRSSLEGVSFTKAQLHNCRLSGSPISFSDFAKATFEQCILSDVKSLATTSLEEAYFHFCLLNNLDLSGWQVSQEMLNVNFASASVALGTNVPPTHWPAQKEVEWRTLHREYQNWLTNPAAYVPPQHRD